MTDHTLEPRLRPRKQPRQQRSVETRARILDAARRVFADHGYAGGTTNRIAEAASMSVGSLYQYFPNKDAILVELVSDHVDQGTAMVAEAMASVDVAAPGGLEAAVRALVAAMVDLHAEERRLHQVLFDQSPRPATMLDRLGELEDLAVDVVAGLLTEAGAAGEDPRLRARMTVVAIESLVHRLVAAGDAIAPDVVADEITRMVLAYLDVGVRGDP